MKSAMIKRMMSKIGAVAVVASLASATGCSTFFPPLDSGSGTTVVNTGDYAYVVSAYTASTPIYALSGFSIGTGTLTALSGLPTTLPFAPATMVVTPSNGFLYVAGSQVVYGYSIASDGSLTALLNTSSSPALVNANIVSMVVSPDGQWLLALDSETDAVTIDEFAISSTGALSLSAQSPAQYALTNGATSVPTSISVSPAGNYVAVALGTGGDVLFSFTTSTGALSAVQQVNPPSTSTADQAIAFDSTGATLYIARSGTDAGVVPYTIGSGGALTVAAGAPFSLGTGTAAAGPSSILIDSTGTYLYVGNKSNSSISAFSIGTGGVLTALSGSPYAAGTTVSALGRDNSGKYILATALGGLPDLQMYSFDTTVAGKLDATTTALTGDSSEPAGALAIALTH